jgi:hypothetical protein
VRTFLAVAAIANLLQATVLFGWTRRLIAWWAEISERQGGSMPAIVLSERFQRAAPIVAAAFFGWLWWYAGTPAGSEAMARFSPSSGTSDPIASVPFWVPPVFLGAALGMWLLIGSALSQLSGWRELARRYPAGAAPPGVRVRGQVVSMGPVSERGVTALIPTAPGLYLYSNPFFRFGRPPLLVPWAEVHEAGEGGRLWWRASLLDLGGVTRMGVKSKGFDTLKPYLEREVD